MYHDEREGHEEARRLITDTQQGLERIFRPKTVTEVHKTGMSFGSDHRQYDTNGFIPFVSFAYFVVNQSLRIDTQKREVPRRTRIAIRTSAPACHFND